LMRRAHEVVQPDAAPQSYNLLNQKINRLRHKLPGPVLSQFDALIRQEPDAIAQVLDGICQGCGETIPAHVAAQVQNARELVHCHHCGRFLYSEQHAPPYVGIS
jgi:predicted  nucleic acid-binding Zn-ribbon protein